MRGRLDWRGGMKGTWHGVGIDLDGPAAIGVVTGPGNVIVEKFELIASSGPGALHPVRPAQEVVGDFAGHGTARVAHHFQLARHNLHTIHEPSVLGGPPPTPAPGLHLNLGAFVSELHQASRSGEHPPLKCGEEAEREDIDAKFVDDSGELFALDRVVELGLIADDRIHRPERGRALAHQLI